LENERFRTCPGNVPVSVGSLSPQAASIAADGLFTGRVRRSPLLTNAIAGREKMPTGNRSGWPEYHRAFEGRDEDFLFYYDADGSGRITEHCWRRDEFWQTARQAAAVLRESRLRAGDRFCLCVGANQPLDLAFRLAAVMTGSIPVTVNWQADTVERVCYKISLTESRLIVADACCLTLEIKTPRAERLLAGKAAHFKHLLNQNVSKNARIDYLRLDSIPRNFKGAVLVKQLVAAFDQYLKGKKQPER
jgi:hypothetical protein